MRTHDVARKSLVIQKLIIFQHGVSSLARCRDNIRINACYYTVSVSIYWKGVVMDNVADICIGDDYRRHGGSFDVMCVYWNMIFEAPIDLGFVARYLKDEAKETKLMGDSITVDGHAD